MPEIIDQLDETQPDAGDVLQRQDPPYAAVRVEPVGPVGVIDLPARVGVMVSYLLSTQTQPILGADPRRKSALLLGLTDSVYVGTSPARVTDGTATLWPAGLPLPLSHTDPLYARAAVAGTVLSVVSEQWTG